jgi:hypothetical protein
VDSSTPDAWHCDLVGSTAPSTRFDPEDLRELIGLQSRYSGAAIVDAARRLIIEGKEGYGDRFMRGEASPETLPERVVEDVRGIYTRAEHALGPLRPGYTVPWSTDLDGRGALASCGYRYRA